MKQKPTFRQDYYFYPKSVLYAQRNSQRPFRKAKLFKKKTLPDKMATEQRFNISRVFEILLVLDFAYFQHLVLSLISVQLFAKTMMFIQHLFCTLNATLRDL